MPETQELIAKLAADGFGVYLPSYRALHGSHPAIRTDRPDQCADEAARIGLPCLNIYLAGNESVVCWPSVPSA